MKHETSLHLVSAGRDEENIHERKKGSKTAGGRGFKIPIKHKDRTSQDWYEHPTQSITAFIEAFHKSQNVKGVWFLQERL